MAEQKKKIPIFGNETDVTDVPIKKILGEEHFTTYELEDGSIVRVKTVATSFLRVDGQFNQVTGMPVYIVLTSPATVVDSSLLAQKVDAKIV
jgi:hypothetical protein